MSARLLLTAGIAVLVGAAPVAAMSSAQQKRPRPSDVPRSQVVTEQAPNGLSVFNDYATPERKFAVGARSRPLRRRRDRRAATQRRRRRRRTRLRRARRGSRGRVDRLLRATRVHGDPTGHRGPGRAARPLCLALCSRLPRGRPSGLRRRGRRLRRDCQQPRPERRAELRQPLRHRRTRDLSSRSVLVLRSRRRSAACGLGARGQRGGDGVSRVPGHGRSRDDDPASRLARGLRPLVPRRELRSAAPVAVPGRPEPAPRRKLSRPARGGATAGRRGRARVRVRTLDGPAVRIGLRRVRSRDRGAACRRAHPPGDPDAARWLSRCGGPVLDPLPPTSCPEGGRLPADSRAAAPKRGCARRARIRARGRTLGRAADSRAVSFPGSRTQGGRRRSPFHGSCAEARASPIPRSSCPTARREARSRTPSRCDSGEGGSVSSVSRWTFASSAR